MQEKAAAAVEAARLYFSNGNITVNLLPAILITFLLSLLVLPLFGVPLLDVLFGSVSSAASRHTTDIAWRPYPRYLFFFLSKMIAIPGKAGQL